MKYLWVILLLAAASVLGQSGERRRPEKDSEPVPSRFSPTVSAASASPAGDRGAFVITPLSALPPSAAAPLLSYLRAISDAAASSSANVRDGSASRESKLPGIVEVTAPLTADRGATTPVVVATPIGKVVPNPVTVPAAPAVFATPAVVATPAVLTTRPIGVLKVVHPAVVPRPAVFAAGHLTSAVPTAQLTLGAPHAYSYNYNYHTVGLPVSYALRYP